MSVVLRCQSCGTTQATAGECKTCHEAQVRYFCTNHEPGLWLEGPTCPRCAVAAAPAPKPVPPRPLAPTRPAPRPVAPTRPAPRPVAPTPAPWPSGLDERPPAPMMVREPVAGPWLKRLVIRLLIIAAVMGVGLLVVIYLVARELF